MLFALACSGQSIQICETKRYLIEKNMKTSDNEMEFRRLTAPRAAAVAGILFSLLFATTLILIRTSIPEGLTADPGWVATGAKRINIALFLMPFAGILFLWFIGTVRDRIGRYEDRFFSTLFLGSGLLFLAMVFASMALVGGLVVGYRLSPGTSIDSQVIYYTRAWMIQFSNIYALRMAGVFMFSLGTIWWRTGLMPRWLAGITYILALTLLWVINLSFWVTLLFPAWILIIDVYVLLSKSYLVREKKTTSADTATATKPAAGTVNDADRPEITISNSLDEQLDQIQKLSVAKEQGLITEEEFQAKKRLLLGI
jgi:hypothetical protein